MFTTARHEIVRIYAERARARYGLEDISQLEHALQTAFLAEKQGESPAFVVAALLHDVGHMLDGLAENPAAQGIDGAHEQLGADWLAARLPAAVSELVRLHVQAKRYLCANDPTYAAHLAPDSVRSLALQGGPMTADESARFLSARSHPTHCGSAASMTRRSSASARHLRSTTSSDISRSSSLIQ